MLLKIYLKDTQSLQVLLESYNEDNENATDSDIEWLESYFQYGEYVIVEFDTINRTVRVLKPNE